MKKIFQSLLFKIISIVLIIAVVCVVAIVLKDSFSIKNTTKTTLVVIQEKLETAAELNTASYLCTDIITKADSKSIKNFKIPFTEKSFVISYSGIVKAGIKDLTKAQVEEKENVIVIKLPPVEITEVTLDNDSFKQLDTTKNIFNPVTPEDVNNAQKDLKEKMINRANEMGILNLAKENAEDILLGMLGDKNSTYKIQIEWQE